MPTTTPKLGLPRPVSTDNHNLANFQALIDAIDNKAFPLDLQTKTGVDINTLNSTGIYLVDTTSTNGPVSSTQYIISVYTSGALTIQLAFTTASNNFYYRRYNASWQTWQNLTRNAASGIAPLDASSLVPIANLPDATTIAEGISQLSDAPANDSTKSLTPKSLYTIGYGDSSNSLVQSASAFDFNTTFTITGMRYLTGTLTNQPSGVTTNVFVCQYRIDATNFIQQIITTETVPRYFTRTMKAGVWSSWVNTTPNVANGVAPLDANSKIPQANMPTATIIENRTTDPASPPNGQIWLRTDL